ncbi:TIGR01777 family oxidoreductase [Candidatus Berkiella aquae]|uniref:Epimerase family protein n=1 Tax=Candidatus Berkiella aquae TaxID=295108 RepID=A0A0Q9YKR8_9GAMM|nr:TIGR01777 family oxidoreductase [Candidatus Berkiella aquae]MCS5710854.1 TIGR01777 family oxidoreductase [Candidatus Berkiella aquae]
MKQILITGGTGLIGQALCEALIQKGYHITVLTRDVHQRQRLFISQESITLIDSLQKIKSETIFDAVVNLAGAPIAKRWTTAYKRTIVQSRINLTQTLIDTLARLKQLPQTLVSGSAIGFYGPQQDQELIETSSFTPSFSHELCQAWEDEANRAKQLGIRVVNLRTGIVLSKRGGALARMRLPFQLGLGGPIGNGQQWMSWIHHEDIVRIIQFCIEKEIEGPVNATAPFPVTNKVFASTYAKVLHRCACLPMPGWLLRLLMGQMAEELLLTGQRVIPDKLQQTGFSFEYPILEKALKNTENSH